MISVIIFALLFPGEAYGGFSDLRDFGKRFSPPLTNEELRMIEIAERDKGKEKFDEVMLKSGADFRGLKCNQGARLYWEQKELRALVANAGLKGDWCTFSEFKFYYMAIFNSEMRLTELTFSAHDSVRASYKGVDVSGWTIGPNRSKYSDVVLKKYGITATKYLHGGTPPASAGDGASYYFLEEINFQGHSFPVGTYIYIDSDGLEEAKIPDKKEALVDKIPCKKQVLFDSNKMVHCTLSRQHTFENGITLPANTLFETASPEANITGALQQLKTIGPRDKDIVVRGVPIGKEECAKVDGEQILKDIPVVQSYIQRSFGCKGWPPE